MLKSRPLHREWQSFDRMPFDIKHQPGIRLLPSRKLSFNVQFGFAAKLARVLFHLAVPSNDAGAITFSGTLSGTLGGARSGAGVGAGVWAGFGTVSGMSIGVEPG